MCIYRFFLITGFVLFSISTQAAWKVRSTYKPVPNLNVDRSVLYFTSGEETKIYAPSKTPYGLISTQKYLTTTGEFYLTGWAQGAQSVVFRVFDMSKEQASPVCEVTSLGEVSRLKLKDQVLLIETVDSLEQKKADWKPCLRIESHK